MRPLKLEDFRNQRGITLFDMLIGLTVTSLVASAVFSGLSQFLLFTTQDEINQNLKDDLLMSMNHIRRDLRVATNVVPRAGARSSNSTTLVLRLPVLDFDNNIVEDDFEFVSYTLSGLGPEDGLLREVWADENATDPIRREILNKNIVTVAFLFGGQNIHQVENLSVIRDIQVFMVSARETGLRSTKSRGETAQYLDVQILDQLAHYGLDFSTLRIYIDYMNALKVDVTVASSLSAVTFRNKKALGVKTPASPQIAS